MAENQAGRPKSDVETTVVAVRIPVDLRERLDRHLDIMEIKHGVKSSRSAMMSHALRFFLDAQDE